MAAETEIERLVVRLTGDTSQYVKSMEDAAMKTGVDAQHIVEDLKKVEDAVKHVGQSADDLRPNSILDDIFGVVRPAPQGKPASTQDMNNAMVEAVAHQRALRTETEQFIAAVEAKNQRDKTARENEYAAAVSRHRQEEARFAQEAASRDRERLQVQHQLTKEAEARMRAVKESHEQSFASQTNFNVEDPFGKPKQSGIQYSDVLKGIGVLYAAHGTAQLAMADAQEELNRQYERSAHLQSQLLEQTSYRASQTDQKAQSLPIKERVEFLKEELRQQQALVAQQRKNVEEADKMIEKTRGPGLGREGEKSKYLPGQALESIAGHTARTLNLGGADTEHEDAIKRRSDLNAVADQTAARVKSLQRELSNLAEGGDNAEQALSRFKMRMEAQTEAIGKGHKALQLYRLFKENNFNEQERKEAEEVYDLFERTNEAYRSRVRVTEEWFAAEEKAYAAVEHTTKQFMTPLEQYIERVDELKQQLEYGLGQDTYNRALDDAKKKYDHATASAQKFHAEMKQGNAVAFGSTDAYFKAQTQSLMLANPNNATGPKGPRDDEIAAHLAEIAKNTKKNDMKGTTVKPANI